MKLRCNDKFAIRVGQLVCASWLVFTLIGAAGAQPRIRNLEPSSKEPIASRLRPDDEIVVLNEEVNVAVLSPDPSQVVVLRDSVRRAEIVAIVDVRAIEPMLVDKGRWVNTQLTVNVRELLKSSTIKPITRGQDVRMEIRGGELTIGKVLVRALPVLPVRVGQEYLVFLTTHPDFASMISTHPLMRIEGDRTLSVRPDGAEQDRLHGMTLEDIRSQLRRLTK